MTLRAFQEVWDTVRAHWFGVVVCGLLGALAATALSVSLPVNYEASARLFLATPNWNDSTASGEPDPKGRVYTYAYGDEYTQKRAMTYEELISTQPVTSRIIERLGLHTTPEELAGRLTARVIPDTVMIDISARDATPEEAARLANGAAEALTSVIEELEKPFKQAVSAVLPVLVSPAEAPVGPQSPRPLLNLLTGVVLGLAVGVTYAAVREWYKTSRVPRDLTVSETTLSVLHGVQDIPAFADLADIGPELAEDVRYLCLRLTTEPGIDSEEERARTILLVAPRATDAVGPTAVLIAAALAELGDRVAIVLTNFAEAKSPPSEPGLGEVLDRRQSLSDVLRYDDTARVGVVTAGTIGAHSFAALASDRMDSVIEELQAAFDYVLVIGCPVLESADSLELASKLAGTVLICPVPPSTGAEIAESERLLGLTPTSYLGRVVVMGRSHSGDQRVNRSSGAPGRRNINAEL
jgi:polysaccharide biosynthesis transport protein